MRAHARIVGTYVVILGNEHAKSGGDNTGAKTKVRNYVAVMLSAVGTSFAFLECTGFCVTRERELGDPQRFSWRPPTHFGRDVRPGQIF